MSKTSTAIALPGPRGTALLGPLYDYEKDPVGHLKTCRNIYGDLFALTPGYAVLCRPDWAQEVLARTNRDFRLVTSRLTRRVSLMSDDLERWTLARRCAWHRLGRKAMDDAMPGISSRVETSLRLMSGHRRSGVEECERIATDALLGAFVHDCPDDVRRLVIDGTRTIPSLTESSLRLPRWASPKVRRFVRATDNVVAGLAEVAARRARSRPRAGEPRDVLDLLVDAKWPGSSDRAFDDIQVGQVLATSMSNVYAVAGAALSWLLATLAAHDYATATWRTADPDFAACWAEAFVKETMRIRPPIWGVGRLVANRVEFGGYELPRGSTVLISTVLLHSDSRWWHEDPTAFDPSRWLDPANPPHVNHAYIPYGSGPRVCIGAQLSHRFLTTAFEIIASSWRVRVEPPSPVPRPAAVVVPDRVEYELSPR